MLPELFSNSFLLRKDLQHSSGLESLFAVEILDGNRDASLGSEVHGGMGGGLRIERILLKAPTGKTRLRQNRPIELPTVLLNNFPTFPELVSNSLWCTNSLQNSSGLESFSQLRFLCDIKMYALDMII